MIQEPDYYSGLRGVTEARGLLWSLGRAGRNQPGIWYSSDGLSWSRADVPQTPDPIGVAVFDLVDVGDRLVALAAGGLAEGSEFYATMVYVSEDGLSWRAADSVPGVEVGAHFALVRNGDRLLAIGQGVWTSLDGGLSWEETAPYVEYGRAFDAAGRDGLVVAVGEQGEIGDIDRPGRVWESSDGGDSWRSTSVGTETGFSVAIDAGGRIVTAFSQSLRTSVDGGDTWIAIEWPCCSWSVVATPFGFALLEGYGAGPAPAAYEVYASTDGATWTAAGSVDFEVNDASWGPLFGLVAAGDNEVLLGPNPFP